MYNEKKNNAAGVTSFVFGIFSYFMAPAGLPPLIAILYGIRACVSFDDDTQKNGWFGVVGLILGIIYFVYYLYEYGYIE